MKLRVSTDTRRVEKSFHEEKGKSYSFTTLLSEANSSDNSNDAFRGSNANLNWSSTTQKWSENLAFHSPSSSSFSLDIAFPLKTNGEKKKWKKKKKKRNERIKKEKYAQQSKQPRLVSGMEGRWKNEKFMKRRLLKRETARAGRWGGNKKQQRRWQRGRNGRSTPGFEKIQSSLCSGPPEKPTIFIFASKALGNQGLFLQRPQKTSGKKEARRDDGLTSVVANENYVQRRF